MPDTAIDASYKLLASVGFHGCLNSSTCVFAIARFSPKSSAHLHIKHDLGILLHRQSDILWNFPALDSKLMEIDSEKDEKFSKSDLIWRASDPRLLIQRQRHRPGQYPLDHQYQISSIRIPCPASYCEALILLMCRNHMTPRKLHWSSHLSYYLDYIDGSDIFTEADLTGVIQRSLSRLKSRRREEVSDIKTLSL